MDVKIFRQAKVIDDTIEELKSEIALIRIARNALIVNCPVAKGLTVGIDEDGARIEFPTDGIWADGITIPRSLLAEAFISAIEERKKRVRELEDEFRKLGTEGNGA